MKNTKNIQKTKTKMKTISTEKIIEKIKKKT